MALLGWGRESSRRIAAASLGRHYPSPRLETDPDPEPVPWAGQVRADDLLLATLGELTDREGRRAGLEPLGLGLAVALAELAEQHPDGEAGLTNHPQESPNAATLVRALVKLGRETKRAEDQPDD